MDPQNQNNKLTIAAAVFAKEQCRRTPEFWFDNFVYTVKGAREKNEEAIQRFPMYRPYMRSLIREWQANKILHIVKSRQMAISWLALGMLLWEAQFYEYSLCVVINKKKELAEDGIMRIRLMYSNQPPWLQNLCPLDRPLRDMPQNCLTFQNGSKIQALPEGPDQVRSLVPATALIDEASFLDRLEATYSACVPCCKRIVTVSSAGPGFFEKLCQ